MVKRARALLIVFLAVVAVVSMPARAQTTSASGFEAMMNGIIRGAPGVTSIAVTDGVTSTAVGSVAVAAGAGAVSVPTTVAAKVGFGTIARGAARVGVRAVPWVGTALVIADVASVIGGAGIVPCPAGTPGWFCKPTVIPGSSQNVAGTPQYRYCTGTAGCNVWENTVGAAQGDFCPAQLVWQQQNGYPQNTDCRLDSTGSASNNWTITWSYYSNVSKSWSGAGSRGVYTQYKCPDGTISPYPDGHCVIPAVDQTKLTPATENDVNDELSKKANADHDWAVAMKAKLDAVAAANTGTETPIDYTAVPVTVTAPQTTGPQTVVSTRTIPNADGSTSTETVKQQVVVTPQITSGGTVSDPKVTWPAQTVTTTSTVNNTTNVTNTTTNTTNVAAPPPAATPQIPTDYNREATQKAILQQLDGSLVTAATPADQEARTATEVGKTDTSLDTKFKALPGEYTNDKSNWFSWVWTPPVGQCSASMFSGSVHGYAVNWDICLWVDRIRDALGFLFALFGAINIYGNLFRKEST